MYTSAIYERRSSGIPRIPSTCSRSAVSATGSVTPTPDPRRACDPLSLSNRLALVFFGITLLAVAALYLYVAPGLQSRLMGEKLAAWPTSARKQSGPISRAVGSSTPLPELRQHGRPDSRRVRQPGDVAVGQSDAQGMRCTVEAGRFGQPPGRRAAALRVGLPRRRGARLVHRDGSWARRATSPRPPTRCSTHTARRRVIVYSAPVVGHDANRQHGAPRDPRRRGDRAAAGPGRRLPGGEGARPAGQAARAGRQAGRRRRLQPADPGDSTDELGQLAVAFNEMQQQLLQLELARKKFIATASHELRTPVFSLGGFVELLEDEELDRRDAAAVPGPGPRSGASGWGSCPSTCWTCPVWRRARWSCGPRKSTSAS